MTFGINNGQSIGNVLCSENKSHIISNLKDIVHRRIGIVVIEGHEGGVDDNAESDEQINEGVEHDKWEEFCEPDVAITAVPYTHNLEALNTEIGDLLF